MPRNISRWQILDIVKNLPGAVSMSLSEPIKNQNYVRYCWVTFSSEESCEKAYENLSDVRINNEYRLSPIKSKSTTLKRIRITAPLFDERLIEDLEFSKLLIHIMDKEKYVEVFFLR